MALFQRLAKTLRPTSSNAISTFRWAKSPRPSSLEPTFLGSRSRGRRSYYGSYNSSEPLNKRLIYGVIGLNTGIFLYHEYTKLQAQQGYPGPFMAYMKHMTLSPIGFLRDHHYWTAITSTFSHGGLLHLAGNMVSFFYLGSLLATTPTFTPLKLATIILGSGLTGSVGWLASKLQQGDLQQRAVGFSGSLMGVGTIAALLYPRMTFHIYGIIPVPLWALMTGYAIYDGYYLSDSRSMVGHGGHLGGIAFGVVYYFAKLRGLRL